jgi:uncharacterized protein YpiB (UPF0302 family)
VVGHRYLILFISQSKIHKQTFIFLIDNFSITILNRIYQKIIFSRSCSLYTQLFFYEQENNNMARYSRKLNFT